MTRHLTSVRQRQAAGTPPGPVRPGHTLLLMALALAGCAVGPNFHPPAAPQNAGYAPGGTPAATLATAVHGGASQRFIPGGALSGEWWTLFRSAPLNRLINQALHANPDIQAAQAALREANENVYAAEGAFFPSVNASGQAERTRISGSQFGQPKLHELLTVSTASLNISYAPDVFGGVRRQVESYAAQAQYQRFQLEATYLTLTSNVVVAAIQEASLRGQIEATRDIIRLEQHQLRVVQDQFRLGAAPRSDVLQQQATLTATEATLPGLEKQLAQTRDKLTALLGRFPNQPPAAHFNLLALHLPTRLPLSLPSQLVEQRPDIRAARATLHAASANVGVAIANQLPQFSITGQVGTETLGFTNLFTPATAVWTIAGGITQKLFDGGTLLHRKRAAVAAFEQAAAQYRSTVIKAFQNVADALRALQADAAAVHAEAAAEQTAAASLTLAREQFHAGAITYLVLDTAERTYQQAHINLVIAEANRFADTAALFQALGGGWWHRSDVAPGAKGSPQYVGFSLSAEQR